MKAGKEHAKQRAAAKAIELVQSGMVVGLGTGSTTRFFVDLLGERLKMGLLSNIQGVPTSQATADQARAWGIPLTSLAQYPQLDLAVDGADEVDPQLNLIKGLGRALLREKIIEMHADRFVVVVDESKLVNVLGQGPVPVEIVPFEAQAHVRWLQSLSTRAELWLEADGRPVITDNQNYLARCWFSPAIPDPQALALQLALRPGIVEHGLFLNMAHQVIVAGENGVQVLERKV